MSAWGPGSAPGWGPPPSAVPAGARDVVVGEAVALELRLAKLPSRALALVIDFAVMALPLFGIGVLAGTAASNTDAALGAAIVLVALVSVVFGYPILCETLSRGRSPGKAALGLRVVREDGGPFQFRHALARALLGILDFYALFGTVAVVTSLVSAKGKRLGDMLAGTVVIRERVPRSNAPPAVMPPHLAAWAATLPVTRLPDVLALEARQVIGRLEELEPEIGASLARQLAEEMLTALGTTAPGGSDPVSVLSAVLAERRNRDLARAGFAPHQGPAGWGPPAPQGWGPPQQSWGAPQPGWGAPPPPTPAWGGPPAPIQPSPLQQAPVQQVPAQPPDQAPPPEPPPPGPFASPG